jgi:hypothetical protein
MSEWKLVPVEPDEAMAFAGARSLIDGQESRPGSSWADEAQMADRAMTAAAPPAPSATPVECPHRDEPRGCYRVRCQLGRKCVDLSAPSAEPSEPVSRDALAWVIDPESRTRAFDKAEPTTECTTCGAIVLGVAEPSEPVVWTRDGWGPDCGPYVEFYTDDEMGSRDRTGWTPLYTHPAPALPDGAVEVLRQALETLEGVDPNGHQGGLYEAVQGLRGLIEQIGGGR